LLEDLHCRISNSAALPHYIVHDQDIDQAGFAGADVRQIRYRPACVHSNGVSTWLPFRIVRGFMVPPPLIATISMFAFKVRLAVLSCGSIRHRKYRVQRGSAWTQT
jgi:hypothetical protein